MSEISEKEVEAALSAWNNYNNSGPVAEDRSDAMRVALEAAALARAEAAKAQAAELAAVKEMYAREGAKALYELERAERAEAKLAEAMKVLDALDRVNRGVDWCDQYEQARRWFAARKFLKENGNGE